MQELEQKLNELIRYAVNQGFTVDVIDVVPEIDIVRIVGTNEVRLVKNGLRIYLELQMSKQFNRKL